MTKERLYGVDLARVIAMFMVVMFHALGHMSGYSDATYAGKIMRALTICCVDLFALISGYVGVATNYKFSRIVGLWIHVVCVGVVVVGVGMAFGVFAPTLRDWVKVFMPFSSHTYWYVTEYFLLFLLMPFLNIGIRATCEKSLGLIIGAVIFVFIVSIPSFTGYDVYRMGNGLTAIWLVLCYIIEGVIRLSFKWCIHPVFCIIGYLISAALQMTRCSGGYASPFVLLEAIFVLLACAKIQVASGKLRGVLLWLSSGAFGVYLWHEQPLLHAKMTGCLQFVCGLTWFMASTTLICVSLTLYISVCVLEAMRRKLFAFLHQLNKELNMGDFPCDR